MPKVSYTNSISGWDAQQQYIERVMDNAAFSAAHPDDTLVLVGPPRFNVDGSSGTIDNLEPVGLMQNFSVNQTRPFQPMMAIGSARQFFLGGKAQGTAQMGRLFVNAQSLMKKLYSNYTITQSDFNYFSEPPSASYTSPYVVNLDSELFLIPFGMGIMIADKSKNVLGAFYMELCVIPTYSIGVAAGQSMILEAVSVLFDRIVPMGNPATLQSKFDTWNTIMSAGSTEYKTLLSDAAMKSNKVANT